MLEGLGKNMCKKKKVRWVVLISWVIFIFVMSNTPGDESSNQSEVIVKILSYLGIDLNSTFGELANLIVRKGAHFTEYFILFLLLKRVNSVYNEGFNIVILVGIVFLYACTDEIHQYFIPGRAARCTDVLIDTAGGIFAAICSSLIFRIKCVLMSSHNKILTK